MSAGPDAGKHARKARLVQVTKIVEWVLGQRVPKHRRKWRNPYGHRFRLAGAATGDRLMTDFFIA